MTGRKRFVNKSKTKVVDEKQTGKGREETEKPKKKKRSRGGDMLLIFIFVIGLLILLYPTISNLYNSSRQSEMVASYDAKIAEMTPEDFDAEWAKVDAYNAEIARMGIYFTSSNTELHNQYLETADILGNGMMGHIQIPKIGVDLPIYHGTSDDVLAFGVGHMEGSSLPGGGPSTHVVLSGHRGLPTSKLFTDLDQLEEGDIFLIYTLDRTCAYKVDQIRIVLPNDVEDLEIIPGEDLCTLVTCTPYGINSHRLLVRGHRVDYPESDYIAADAVGIDPLLVATIIAVPAFIAVMVFALTGNKRRKGKVEGSKKADRKKAGKGGKSRKGKRSGKDARPDEGESLSKEEKPEKANEEVEDRGAVEEVVEIGSAVGVESAGDNPDKPADEAPEDTLFPISITYSKSETFELGADDSKTEGRSDDGKEHGQ
ncbi:MAG: class C sortase [Coriobacteriales bacterium]